MTKTVNMNNYGDWATRHEEMLTAVRAMAMNDAARSLMQTGIMLTHDEADDLGEERLDWMRRRLALSIEETDMGVRCTPRVNVDRVNVDGYTVDFETAVNMMDDQIREDLHGDGYEDPQAFVDAYAEAHLLKTGQVWHVI